MSRRPTPLLALLSRLAGHVARARASRCLIPWFARHYRINLDEAALPLEQYPSLQQFFCRGLKPGLRPIAAAADVLVSPVDGTLGACGIVASQQLFQAKGSAYSLAGLLGDAPRAPAPASFEGGAYCTLYLAPSNYHRVHAPEAGRVAADCYIPGAFHSVNPRIVAKIPALFAGNERWVTYLDTDRGCVAIVLVGACLVGGIRMNQPPPYVLARGQELGRFEFGSTVILIAQPSLALELAVAPGAAVRVGEALLRAASPAVGAEIPRPDRY